MKHYEVKLFSSEELIDEVTSVKCNSIIQALDCFTDMCKSGREDYNLDEYYVWLYDRDKMCNVMFYTYDAYAAYEELTLCQY